MRKDYQRLQYVEGLLKDIYASKNIEVNYSETEDYGIDYTICLDGISGRTCGQTEVKTVSTKYGPISGDYFTYSSTTDASKWRWCADGTQDEINNDKTSYPEYLKGKRLIILNDYKFDKLKAAKAGLIYLAEDCLLIFSYKQLLAAEEGHGWLQCRHTKEFSNHKCQWERKTLLNIEKGQYYPIDNVPTNLLN